MINGNSVLGLIPARSGSKGIKNKNTKDFMGIPLIGHTIQVSKKINYIDELIVSTDDERIKEISEKFGAKVPYLRPKHLSNDTASNIDVALHAINKIKTDILIILQPTSPLRIDQDISRPLEILFEKKAKMVVSVSKVKNYPYSFQINDSNYLKSAQRIRDIKTNRQMHEDFYTVNGSTYVSFSDYFKLRKTFFTEKTYAYRMPQVRSVDIDDLDDWDLAEKLYNKK